MPPHRHKLALLRSAIADVEAGRLTTPLIGPRDTGGEATVVFLARRGAGPVPRIVSDVTGWGERPDDTFDFKAGTMTRVGAGDWYFLETTVAPLARIEYLVAHGRTDYRCDPFNPRQTSQRGGAPASEFVMPGYAPPREFEDPPVTPSGHVTKDTIRSAAFGEAREVVVYTPPGYREGSACPLAVFHGLNVVTTGEGPRVLDWLIARRAIEPVLAVFVDSWSRDTDERSVAATRSFLTGELMDWLAARYGRVGALPGASQSGALPYAARAILGISFGARDALDAATSADVFDRVGLLIPGRRLRTADIEAFVARSDRRLRVAILAGHYDSPNLPTARRAREALAGAGHTVDYIEVPEGHNASTWRNHLSAILVSLFAAPPSSRTGASSGPNSN